MTVQMNAPATSLSLQPGGQMQQGSAQPQPAPQPQQQQPQQQQQQQGGAQPRRFNDWAML